jgi:hypothetical protein
MADTYTKLKLKRYMFAIGPDRAGFAHLFNRKPNLHVNSYRDAF